MQIKIKMSDQYTSIRITKIKIATPPNADRNVVKKLDHSYIADGNVKCYGNHGKQFSSFLKN